MFSLRYKLVVACVAVVLASVLSVADDQKDKSDPKKEKATVTIKTVAGNKWDPAETKVKDGDIVEWTVDQGFHGLAFKDGKKARDVLDFQKGGFEVKMQKGFKPPIEATHDDGDGTDKKGQKDGFLVRAKVKAVPQGVTEVPFFCTVHGEKMGGKLKF